VCVNVLLARNVMCFNVATDYRVLVFDGDEAMLNVMRQIYWTFGTLNSGLKVKHNHFSFNNNTYFAKEQVHQMGKSPSKLATNS